jgi:hypothetical protein
VIRIKEEGNAFSRGVSLLFLPPGSPTVQLFNERLPGVLFHAQPF